MIFLDTNIFVYAVSAAPDDAAKRMVSREILGEGNFVISLQVVQEFIHVVSRKARLGQTSEAIRQTAEMMLAFPLALLSPALVLKALFLKERYEIQYWDAAILAAAAEYGCHTLDSEDLSHGQDYEGVKVINPFV